MLRYIIFSIVLFGICDISAQNLVTTGLYSGMSSQISKGVYYSCTIGQPVQAYNINNKNKTLIQGFYLPQTQHIFNNKPEQIKPEHTIHAFPNPMTDCFSLVLDEKTSEQLQSIQIFDITGKLQKQINLNNKNKFQSKFDINTSDLTQGYFIVKIQSGNPLLNKQFKILKLRN